MFHTRLMYGFTIVLMTFCIYCYGELRTVSHDGSAQFTDIQLAIFSSSSGDTILVNPGIYYENIDYSGRNLNIVSMEFTTGNPTYRDSTIIDGNNNGSTVKLVTNENGASLYGFTIRNGSGTPTMEWDAVQPLGGGIRINHATNFTISNCIIINNKAAIGGGIHIQDGFVNLKNNRIYNNYASIYGGGIFFGGSAWGNFDTVERCSVYENYAGFINDIAATDDSHPMDVILDIFTVNPPTPYYIDFNTGWPGLEGDFNSINVLRGYRAEVNHNLYLSPSGNDNNDGFSVSTPLKTIAKALHTIASDHLNPKTIYLAPGVYSSEDGQMFPLSMKTYVNVIGDVDNPPTLLNSDYSASVYWFRASENTLTNIILEHDDNHPNNIFLMTFSYHTTISNLTINPVEALSEACLCINYSDCDMDNIRLNGLTSGIASGIRYEASNGSIRNIRINDCHATDTYEYMLNFATIEVNPDSTFVMENVTVTNCEVLHEDNSIIKIEIHPGQNPRIVLSNVLVANNTITGTIPIHIYAYSTLEPVQITNCDFVHNYGTYAGASILGNSNIANCIFDNNTSRQVCLNTRMPDNAHGQVALYNNCIRDFPGSVYASEDVFFNLYNIGWNPCFLGTNWADPLNYRLDNSSFCINAGTQDTTGLNIPTFDLLGNPRIFNNRIDIGCYEWNGTEIQDENISPMLITSGLNISPNPFINHTLIRYELDKSSYASVAVYNTKGQLIRNIVNELQTKGIQVTAWDGRDTNGKLCSSGIYLIKLLQDSKQVSTKKVTLVK